MKTILVVDDDPDILEGVRMVLKMNGYRVITAMDGDECLQILKEEIPDLILLDIMMPGSPVKSVVDQIKDIKIVFMSIVRKNDAEERGLCNQPNVVEYIQKPFNIDEMVNKIEAILNK